MSMEQGELEGSPLNLHSPDIEILADDEVAPPTSSGSPHSHKHRGYDNDNEESLDIKPPQVPNHPPSKRDKHKHRHKEDRKRDREREKERGSRHERDRADRGKHRSDKHERVKSSDPYEETRSSGRDKEKERDRMRRREQQHEIEVEAKRREKSQQERDRLERLERERRKLEREAEREQRDREHREKVRQEQERIAKAEREQERITKAEREQERLKKAEREQRFAKHEREERSVKTLVSRPQDRSHRRTESDSRHKTHSTRQDVEKRRDKDRDKHRVRRDLEGEHSRSRSPYDRHAKYRSDYESREEQEHHRRVEHDSDVGSAGVVDDDDDRLMEAAYHDPQGVDRHGDDEQHHEKEASPAEASSDSSSESDSDDSDSDSDSDSDDSNASRKSPAHSEEVPLENEADNIHSHHKSKFDYDEEMDADEGEYEQMSDDRRSIERNSPVDSRTDGDEDYLEETPPPSPIELAPELPVYLPAIQGCRNVDEFHCLNRIEEGTYGVVYRARDKKTEELVALKRLKMEKEKEGFPITSLREINTLLKSQHPNIVTVREIVVGNNMDKIYIVMEYVEHDLKSLMQTMKEPFIIGEVKTLMKQLLRGVAHLHDNWIIHRDLKTSNLLLSHNAILKIGDFGLAREYGSPLKPYTPIVVTLWYRSPELLLGIKEYSTYIDMWSVGCIFAEFLTMKPLFPGKSEIDQLNRVFKELGTPNEKIWPGVSELPTMKKVTFAEYPYNQLRERFSTRLSDKGFDLMNRFLTYDPKRRITARDGLDHEYFEESPLPVLPSMFPTWPAKSEQTTRNHGSTPRPPSGGKAYAKLLGEDDEALERGFHMSSQAKGGAASMGFSLKF